MLTSKDNYKLTKNKKLDQKNEIGLVSNKLILVACLIKFLEVYGMDFVLDLGNIFKNIGVNFWVIET